MDTSLINYLSPPPTPRHVNNKMTPDKTHNTRTTFQHKVSKMPILWCFLVTVIIKTLLTFTFCLLVYIYIYISRYQLIHLYWYNNKINLPLLHVYWCNIYLIHVKQYFPYSYSKTKQVTLSFQYDHTCSYMYNQIDFRPLICVTSFLTSGLHLIN